MFSSNNRENMKKLIEKSDVNILAQHKMMLWMLQWIVVSNYRFFFSFMLIACCIETILAQFLNYWDKAKVILIVIINVSYSEKGKSVCGLWSHILQNVHYTHKHRGVEVLTHATQLTAYQMNTWCNLHSM